MLVEAAALATALPLVPETMFDPMGPVAAEQKAHMIRVVVLTMIAIVPVLVGVPLLVWRYRRRPGSKATYSPNWGFNGWLELAMWGVPVAIIAVLAGALVYSTKLLDPARPIGPEPLKVQAIGLNWKWVFIYPQQGVATIDQLVVPVGRPVELVMTSDTVMLSPMAAALSGQIYVMPGMITRQNLQADRTGRTTGRNMMYNGDGFAGQAFTVEAVPTETFKAWATTAAGSTVTLDAAGYARIAAQGTGAQARTMLGLPDGSAAMRMGDPALFQQVVGRYHKGTAVTAGEQPGTASYGGGDHDGGAR